MEQQALAAAAPMESMRFLVENIWNDSVEKADKRTTDVKCGMKVGMTFSLKITILKFG